MQALQPEIKKIQSTYQSNPEVMNQKIAAIYQDNEVNPLAGCIPSLVQLPVFIGLYRAVLNLAKADRLEEVRVPCESSSTIYAILPRKLMIMV